MKLKDADKRTLIVGAILVAAVLIAAFFGFKAISRYKEKEEAARKEYEMDIARRYWESEAEAEAERHRQNEPQTVTVTPTESPVAGPVVTVLPTPKVTFTPTPTPTPTPKVLKMITATVVARSYGGGGLSRISPDSYFATSELHQEGYDNSGWAAVDGDSVTSWQEDVAGNGTGEILYYTLGGYHDVKCIFFKLGNWRSSSSFGANNRPRAISIWLGEYYFSVYFPDGMTEYCVEFSSPVPASDVYFQIDSVFKGTYNDCCISEITICE